MDFSFLFCRFCRFYSMRHDQVLGMPARRFWMMESQIERVSAYEKLQDVPLHQVGMEGEHVKKYVDRLQESLGDVYDVRPEEFVKTDEDQKKRLQQLSRSVGKGVY